MHRDQIEHALAMVTAVMVVLVPALHIARAITTRLRAYALTTPEKWDDVVTTRVLRILDGLDALVDAVSAVVPRPPQRLNPTPGSERAGVDP